MYGAGGWRQPGIADEASQGSGRHIMSPRGLSRVTGADPGAGRGCHPAMVRAQARALALSPMPGNSRRSSMAADSSPSCSKMARIGVSGRSEVASCCALDEGRSLGAALQEEASNHHERLLLNGDGRERHGQKARLDRVRYG